MEDWFPKSLHPKDIGYQMNWFFKSLVLKALAMNDSEPVTLRTSDLGKQWNWVVTSICWYLTETRNICKKYILEERTAEEEEDNREIRAIIFRKLRICWYLRETRCICKEYQRKEQQKRQKTTETRAISSGNWTAKKGREACGEYIRMSVINSNICEEYERKEQQKGQTTRERHEPIIFRKQGCQEET